MDDQVEQKEDNDGVFESGGQQAYADVNNDKHVNAKHEQHRVSVQRPSTSLC